MNFKPISYFLLTLGFLSCTPNQKAIEQVILNSQYESHPNIVWLVAEDLGPYIPAFGDSTVSTPNLDKLASSGVCYDNFYSAHPVCAPARASIATGKYANRIAASHMRTGPWYSDEVDPQRIKTYAKRLPNGVVPYEAMPPSQVKMFTEFLRSMGYYCTNNSKQDYQFRKTMTAWDESSGKAHWRNRKKNQPFFSVFNFNVTHESKIWSKAKDSLWIDENLDIPVPPYLPDTQTAKKDVRRMYSNIKEMDAQIGNVLQQLDDDGLLDNTIVFWYTDHGGPLPRQKRLLYDSGTKVPMIIQFPDKLHKGKRDDRMISFIDLAPTILSLANINPPEYMDGSAFLGSYIRSEEPKYVFGAADRFDETTDQIRSARDHQFKYIKNFMPDKPMYLENLYRNQMPIMKELLRLKDSNDLTEYQKLWFRMVKPKEELYNLMEDPHELHNLADNPKFKDKLLELRKACNNWILEEEDTGLLPEPELLSKIWPDGQQPITSDPLIEIDGSQITLSCNTDGASIGYKILNEKDDRDKSWQIYNKPFNQKENTKIVAVAHRIGYIRSAEIEYTNSK